MENLPEPVLAGISDFAELLCGKMILGQMRSNDELLVDLTGGLEGSATFAGDPLLIQKRLRDEAKKCLCNADLRIR